MTDLGWLFVSDIDRRRQLATWWPHHNDDINQVGHLVVDGASGAEDLGVMNLTDARLICDEAATVTQLRLLVRGLLVPWGDCETG